MPNCKRCSLKNTEICHLCRETAEEIRLYARSKEIVNEIVRTRQVELEPIEDDPQWWEIHMMFHLN